MYSNLCASSLRRGAIGRGGGPHLYLTEPSGNYYEYVAMAIGSRSQTSRTHLEKEFENLKNCSKDDLIKHAIKALAASLSSDTLNIVIAYIV
jgi:20S proteasome subunit alpha 6